MRAQLLNCRRCNFSVTPVPGEGSLLSDIMLVGEAPGFHEDESKRPFVGPAGKVLNRILKTLNISRAALYITNVVKCRTMLEDRNRTPTPDEVAMCKRWLEQELMFSSATIVIFFGETAARTAFPASDIGAVRGRLRFNGRRLYGATYHPAAVFRDPDLEQIIVDDLRKMLDTRASIR